MKNSTNILLEIAGWSLAGAAAFKSFTAVQKMREATKAGLDSTPFRHQAIGWLVASAAVGTATFGYFDHRQTRREGVERAHRWR